MNLGKKSCGKYSKIAAGMESNNIVPGRQGLRGIMFLFFHQMHGIYLQRVYNKMDFMKIGELHVLVKEYELLNRALIMVFSSLKMLIFHRSNSC